MDLQNFITIGHTGLANPLGINGDVLINIIMIGVTAFALRAVVTFGKVSKK